MAATGNVMKEMGITGRDVDRIYTDAPPSKECMKHIPNTHINCQIPKNEYTPHMTGTGNAMKQMGFT